MIYLVVLIRGLVVENDGLTSGKDIEKSVDDMMKTHHLI